MSSSANGRLGQLGRWLALAGGAATGLAGVAAAATALLPMPSLDWWAVGLLVLEFSLLVSAAGLLGLALGLVGGRRAAGRGRRWTATAVVAVNLALVILGALPGLSAWSTARELDATLALDGYLDGLSSEADRGPDATVRYAEVDGEDLMLDVWTPVTDPDPDRPRPIVVNVHGGAEEAPQSLFPRWDVWLTELDHVVFDVDYRFFRDGDWRTPPGDLTCALGWIAANAERYGADPDRVTMMGQSAGGYLALLTSYTTTEELGPTCDAPAEPAEVSAVIAWYAPGDATAEISRHPRLGETVWRQLSEETWRLADEDWGPASPSTYLRADLPPTLLIQGGRDVLQQADQTRAFADLLEEAGVDHTLVEIPYADHQFDISWGGFGSQLARHAISEFLTTHG
ncbi:alpha/beta hydrolase [Actinoalloteichus spitiensis]|uniref:alpha/beta hydrolase n=1 Tax=Actinoalloteichus spitiensis TaxID=252394 RepID=UPI0009FDFD59|nr:alpha/beta hydrolase [Actinoalloteichus spitiensis]